MFYSIQWVVLLRHKRIFLFFWLAMACLVGTTARARDTIDVYESLHSYVLVGQAAKGETFDLTGPSLMLMVAIWWNFRRVALWKQPILSFCLHP